MNGWWAFVAFAVLAALVLYYLKDGRVRGVLLWSVWGQVDAARQLIAAPLSLRKPVGSAFSGARQCRGRESAGRGVKRKLRSA